MAVIENAGVELSKSVCSASSNRTPPMEHDHPKHGQIEDHIDSSLNQNNNGSILRSQPDDQSLYVNAVPPTAHVNGGQKAAPQVAVQKSFDHAEKIRAQTVQVPPAQHQRSNGGVLQRNGDHMVEENFKRDMRELSELFSKLNPMAEEFVPPSLANNHGLSAGFFTNNMFLHNNIKNNNSGNRNGNFNGYTARRRNKQGKQRMNSRTSLAQQEERIRRTVYVSDIDQQVTEEQLAALFITCGQVVDCRICGDPNSVLRFAFIEFTDEEGARAALSLAGTMLGFYPVRVLPSKTAIAPVNPTFLPRSEDEREMCARTIYCTNIDKKVSQAEVKLFFESLCGEVYRLRILGDCQHSTRIAFVEFVMAESAIAALNCSGVVLGSLPIRVSPSKTPVRPRGPRISMQ